MIKWDEFKFTISWGPIIDKMAAKGNHTYNLPVPLDDESYNFSFSGLKSAVINLNHKAMQRNEEINQEDLAACFFKIVDFIGFSQ